MRESVADSKCRSQVSQSLFEFGYAIQNNEDNELILERLSRLQFSLNNYIGNELLQHLKACFDLTDLELKILAIAYINAIEPETVSVFLQASWFENGPSLTLERMFILCQIGGENKVDHFNYFIKNSRALAWGLIQLDRSHLALIQPVTLADDVFNFLLGDGLSFMVSPINIVKLDAIKGDIISQAYAGELVNSVDRINIIKGLTLNERSLFVSQLARVYGSSLYRFSNSETNESLQSELRSIVIHKGGQPCLIYWPELLECCSNSPENRMLVKLISAQDNLKLFFDGDGSAVGEDDALHYFLRNCFPIIQSRHVYTLVEPTRDKSVLAWKALSAVISKSHVGLTQPLSIKEINNLALLYPILPGDIYGVLKELERLDLQSYDLNLYHYCQEYCLKTNSQSMGELAQVCEPRYTISNMVLMEKTQEKMSEIISRIQFSDQLKHALPGFLPGLKALFWGKPGTGKSMAAEAIAGQLKLPLYKINLANIASKWIGETEKHLAEVFDKGQKQNAVLMFDEADAIFSRRSEIESSHDKNANMGVSFLLQRMESYTGLLLLSTNFKSNLDIAFLRRFHSLIEFPMPDIDARKLLWKKAWAGQIKLDPRIDLLALADLHEFSPSQITNIAERSVLFALMKGIKNIDKLVLATAISRELEKQDENYLASKKLNAWLAQ